jgi:uncharacterized membrane protein (DUF373 family)
MQKSRKNNHKLKHLFRDENFLHAIEFFERFVARVLSIALVIVIMVALVDLVIYLFAKLQSEPVGFFNTTVIEIFGVFLNILIALELLENITAYLQKQILQVQLVIVTSLIAVARKIIIFDLDKENSEQKLISLGIAILALSISYLLVHFVKEVDKTKDQEKESDQDRVE